MTTDEARYPTDGSPDTAHFCAEDADGRVISVVTLLKEAPPWQPGTPNAWHLRGMATEPEWRGGGAGSALLAATLAFVAGSGGGLLWCNARLGAVSFYKRAGLNTTGDPWEEPVIGPHIAMFVNIKAGGTPFVAAGE